MSGKEEQHEEQEEQEQHHHQQQGIDNDEEELRKKLEEMKREAAQIQALSEEQRQTMAIAAAATNNGAAAGLAGAGGVSGVNVDEEKEDVNIRSIFVSNVDYSASPEELQLHFQSCGTINRVTILCDKVTQRPKGYAYVEFLEEQSVQNAMLLHESVFKGRILEVKPKRNNVPYFQLRGRGGMAPGGGRGGRVSRAAAMAAAAAAAAAAAGYYPMPMPYRGFSGRGGAGGAMRGAPRGRASYYKPY